MEEGRLSTCTTNLLAFGCVHGAFGHQGATGDVDMTHLSASLCACVKSLVDVAFWIVVVRECARGKKGRDQ
jgi:hypothetical protein